MKRLFIIYINEYSKYNDQFIGHVEEYVTNEKGFSRLKYVHSPMTLFHKLDNRNEEYQAVEICQIWDALDPELAAKIELLAPLEWTIGKDGEYPQIDSERLDSIIKIAEKYREAKQDAGNCN